MRTDPTAASGSVESSSLFSLCYFSLADSRNAAAVGALSPVRQQENFIFVVQTTRTAEIFNVPAVRFPNAGFSPAPPEDLLSTICTGARCPNRSAESQVTNGAAFVRHGSLWSFSGCKDAPALRPNGPTRVCKLTSSSAGLGTGYSANRNRHAPAAQRLFLSCHWRSISDSGSS